MTVGFCTHAPTVAESRCHSQARRSQLTDCIDFLPIFQATLNSKAFLRGEKFDPSTFSFNAANLAGGAANARMAGGRRYSGARAAYGDYPNYPEGRPIFLPEAERFGNAPDLPSLLLQNRIIYISMPVSRRGVQCVGLHSIWTRCVVGPACLVC